jgi:hypothetical protein
MKKAICLFYSFVFFLLSFTSYNIIYCEESNSTSLITKNETTSSESAILTQNVIISTSNLLNETISTQNTTSTSIINTTTHSIKLNSAESSITTISNSSSISVLVNNCSQLFSNSRIVINIKLSIGMNFLRTFSNLTSDDSIILAANYKKFVTI